MASETSIVQVNYFSKIINGGVPCEFLYEDEECVVFDEINPQAPVHFLVVPKKLIPHLTTASEEHEKLLGHLLLVAKNMAVTKGLHKTGYHVMYSEDYKNVKSRPFTIHVFGRALHHMLWPVGPGSRL